MPGFSDFIVYVDESGDHGLASVDPHYPVFVLAFCIFNKRHYSETVVEKVQKFKFKHFGHDLAILHEHDIRKERGEFSIFSNREHKNQFLGELTDIVESSNFVLVSCVIEKKRLRERYEYPANPYHLALAFGLERIYRFLKEKNQHNKITHVVLERRGQREDDELELEFRRVCDGANWFRQPLPFSAIFADKKTNSAGLQLADLVARPIGLRVLRPEQDNRAFRVLEDKFYCRGGRDNTGNGYDGLGLKKFP
ncbi:DUF3800 domain-containing protein [Arhodomonas aquaeolei]|uniref:DUF3800 domain-containing protein n=1 Tax=Arhodomonas aquaeolei TaxID=2369 RepID=UPI0009FF4AB7|nr:DUF3800 domain-containing protein [Arhodomonas aquaeolei]